MTPYRQNELDDGSTQVINHYRIKTKNQSFDTLDITLSLNGDASEVELVSPTFPLALPGGQIEQQHIFFKFPGSLTAKTGKHAVALRVTWRSPRGESVRVEHLTLVGPYE